jgi:hypothetical protein
MNELAVCAEQPIRLVAPDGRIRVTADRAEKLGSIRPQHS